MKFMFLQNQINLKVLTDFFALPEQQFCPQSRPIERFFSDIQRTMEADGLENLQLYLLTARESIYQSESGKDVDILLEYGWERYKQRLRKVSFLFECCHTLTWAEKQQKAFERQIETNDQEVPPFFTQKDPVAFFEQLYEMKVRHGFYTPAAPKDVWLQGCEDFYGKCRTQPIPAMLLPALLTIFATDGKTFSNLYACFKYKNRRFSVEKQKQVVLLFKEICEAVKKYIPVADSFSVPIFYWNDIKRTFCSHKGLSGMDAEIAGRYFDEYCNRNDLSKAKERELLKFPYGNDIRSLAKLCNLNAYIMMSYLPPKHIPAKARRPLRLLKDGKLLPKIPHMESQRGFDHFFCGLYQEIPAIPSFSQLALMRYYRLPLDLYLDTDPDFFPDLEEGAVSAISQYADAIQRNYWRDPNRVFFSKDEQYRWLNDRANVRIRYQLDNILERLRYIKHAKAFANDIVAAFTEDDYRDFIRQDENFHVYFFPKYLRGFCEKYALKAYTDASDQEACFLEDEAFSTILILIRTFLLENIHHFWNEAVARELYT